MSRLTKIIATLGIRKQERDALPDDASRGRFDAHVAEYVTSLIDVGMDVARFNLSFGPAEFFIPYMRMIRDESSKRGVRVGILCDLQGPKVRLGSMPKGMDELLVGDVVRFRADGTNDISGGAIPIVHRDPGYDLFKQLLPGVLISIDEGQLACLVKDAGRPFVDAEVIKGGHIEGGKGVMLRGQDGMGITLGISSITEKDAADLKSLAANPDCVDHIALSFVHDDADIIRLRTEYLAGPLARKSVVAKIETAQAVSDLDELEKIIDLSDCVMVARGDLGIERPLAELLRYQKEIIPMCIRKRVNVVVATQMLESMRESELPTRAEVSDVSNAVYDGADAVMLSGETASGKYPVQSVKMMSDICIASENHLASETYRGFHPGYLIEPRLWGADKVAASVAEAAVGLASGVGASAILVNSMSGNTARLVSRLRPDIPIETLTPDEDVIGLLTLTRGVVPYKAEAQRGVEETCDYGIRRLKLHGLAKSGDKIVYLSGSHIGIGGASNQLQVVDVE